MVECWICGEKFEPDPEKIKAWGESGEDFEPTDWECCGCIMGDLDDDEMVGDFILVECTVCYGEGLIHDDGGARCHECGGTGMVVSFDDDL